jgi:PERQ amino acid-rich with GYF domain-containing protein
MQTWYDQGYFTPDLLMKRTSIDSEWVAVGELQRRATLPKIFLSPWITPLPPGPPGLGRRPDDSFSQRDTNAFASPYQAIPGNSLPPSTLDSYVNGVSNMPDSPSSSFSAGRFGTGSPDPATFGARNTSMFSDHSSTAIGRRSTYLESTLDPTTGLSSFTNSTPVRAATFDNHMFPGMFIFLPYNHG